jgi:hypothetical protein
LLDVIGPAQLRSLFDNTMNRYAVLFHLREAAEELSKMVSEIEQKRSYSEAALEVAMGHL